MNKHRMINIMKNKIINMRICYLIMTDKLIIINIHLLIMIMLFLMIDYIKVKALMELMQQEKLLY